MTWFFDKKLPKMIDGKINSKVSLIFESKKDLLRQAAQDAKDKISSEAQIRAAREIAKGRERVVVEKQICARIIIEKAVEEHKKQQGEIEPRKTEEKDKEKNEERSKETIHGPEISSAEIEKISSFKGLEKLLAEGRKIIGSKGKEYDAEKLMDTVRIIKLLSQDSVDRGVSKEDNKSSPAIYDLLGEITRSNGLRDKVTELVENMFEPPKKKIKIKRKSAKKPAARKTKLKGKSR